MQFNATRTALLLRRMAFMQKKNCVKTPVGRCQAIESVGGLKVEICSIEKNKDELFIYLSNNM
jgi:hypothetical protein